MINKGTSRQRGDTIVEVLLAIVVASAVLAGAYVSTNRSTNTTIRSREHDEGVKLAQSQIEQVRASAAGTATETRFFCLESDNPTTPRFFAGSFTMPPIEASNGSWPAECILDGNSRQYDPNPPRSSVGARYLTAVQNTNPTAPETEGDLYRVTVRWEKAGGGWDQVQFVYRLYP